jgi:hypothetical protein
MLTDGPLILDLSVVIRGLDPRTQPDKQRILTVRLGGRVKPGHDERMEQGQVPAIRKRVRGAAVTSFEKP